MRNLGTFAPLVAIDKRLKDFGVAAGIRDGSLTKAG
jgi:hypothetical protein